MRIAARTISYKRIYGEDLILNQLFYFKLCVVLCRLCKLLW